MFKSRFQRIEIQQGSTYFYSP